MNKINKFLQEVFLYMGIGLSISALTAYTVLLNKELVYIVHNTWVFYLVAFAPLVITIIAGYFKERLSAVSIAILMTFVVTAMGASLALILGKYTASSIIMSFLSASILFIVMSMWGYITKRDLTSIGNYLIIGLIVVIIISLINFFIGSSLLHTILNIISVIIFLGLTAYDIQKLKEIGESHDEDNTEERQKLALFGALELYLDLINLFIKLLQLFGEKK